MMLEEQWEVISGSGAYMADTPEPVTGPMDTAGYAPERAMGEMLVIGPGVDWVPQTTDTVPRKIYVPYEDEPATAVPSRPKKKPKAPDYDDPNIFEAAWDVAKDIIPAVNDSFAKQNDFFHDLPGAIIGDVVETAVDVAASAAKPIVEPIANMTLIMMMMMMSNRR